VVILQKCLVPILEHVKITVFITSCNDMAVMEILHIPFSCIRVTNEIDMENNRMKVNHEHPKNFVCIWSCCLIQAFAVETENCSVPKN
jgi:hypothetical protein